MVRRLCPHCGRRGWYNADRRAGAGGDVVGQLMLMLLGKEGELMISCWICKKLFQDRRALRRYELEAHLSHFTRCGARHSGRCATEPKSVQVSKPAPSPSR